MLLHHGNIIRDSRIPPQFFKRKLYLSNVAPALNTHYFEIAVPDNRDLLLANVSLIGRCSGAETIVNMVVSLADQNNSQGRGSVPISPAINPAGDDIILMVNAGGGAGVANYLNYNPTSLYLPAKTLLRGAVLYSAAALAKYSEINIVGWLVPQFDASL